MPESPWFSKAFGSFYTEVYAHRNEAEAIAHLPQINQLAQLTQQPYSILDLGCGQGRYSHLLQQNGHRVTAVDYSFELLNLAKLNYPSLRLCRGNMLSLPFQPCFDRILSLFTSFGYFLDDADNSNVLREMHHCLKPKGLLYLDFLNAHLVTASSWEEKALGSYLQKSRKHLIKTQNVVRKDIELWREDKLVHQYFESVKLYPLKWFELQASHLGFDLQHVYGDYLGNPFDFKNSPRLILLLMKR